MCKEIQWGTGEKKERKEIIQLENIWCFAVSFKPKI